ncbi:RNA-binding motif protein, X-linked 2-like [Echinops telfairi]|uniref:RNA-binding motif protein, X-linked 2-like n=1 Tax=Echinops telfairi TaxID=9371 RepID=A0AC55CRG4_ECHTE|nr:RNA-binding motif protein, X-linked 2-like [Echinops telfairi]
MRRKAGGNHCGNHSEVPEHTASSLSQHGSSDFTGARSLFSHLPHLLLSSLDKKEKKKRKKAKERPEREVLAEPLPSSSSPSIKVIPEEPGLKKHYSKSSNRAPTAEAREGRKQQPSSPDGRRAADPERKEKPRIEPKSSSKREGKEDKSRDRDGDRRWDRDRDRDQGQGRSTDTHPGWPSSRSEGRSHRSRSRDRAYRHKRSWHSQGGEGSIPGAADPRPAQPHRRV